MTIEPAMKYFKTGRRLLVDIPADHPLVPDLKSRGFKWDPEGGVYWRGFTNGDEAWLKKQKAARLIERLATLLRSAMGQRDVSCSELSKSTGISVRSIQRWRHGDHLKLEALEKVCEALGFDIEIALTTSSTTSSTA